MKKKREKEKEKKKEFLKGKLNSSLLKITLLIKSKFFIFSKAQKKKRHRNPNVINII